MRPLLENLVVWAHGLVVLLLVGLAFLQFRESLLEGGQLFGLAVVLGTQFLDDILVILCLRTLLGILGLALLVFPLVHFLAQASLGPFPQPLQRSAWPLL